MSAPRYAADKLSMTGTGVSGSGGVKAGRVKGITMKKTGHLAPMEKVDEVAENCAGWISAEMQRWRKDEEVLDEMWAEVQGKQRYTLSDQYLEELKGDTKAKLERLEKEKTRNGAAKQSKL